MGRRSSLGGYRYAPEPPRHSIGWNRYRNDVALPQFVQNAKHLLAGVEEQHATDIAAQLDADATDVGAWFGDLIATIDDALFA
jgi:hypothetical protein